MPRPKKEKPTRKDGLYEVKITAGKTLEGKLIRKSFYSAISKADAKRQAEEWKIQQEVANRTGNVFIKRDVTFAEWAAKWLETYKKPNVDEGTYNTSYLNPTERHLIPYFGHADLKDIRPIDVQKFYTQKSKMSKSTLDKFRMILNGIFESAIDNDLCVKNPAKRVSVVSKVEPKEKRVYTNEQIQLVEDYAIFKMPEIVILLETGLRMGELLGLKWEDIDFYRETISVNRSISIQKGGGARVRPPKWKSYRTNPLSRKCCTILASIPHKEEYIFPAEHSGPQRPDTWRKRYMRFMLRMSKDIGVPVLNPHELRHTYGTKLRRDGTDIYSIQKIMGHKDIKVTTEIYVHNEIDSLRRAIAKSL